MLGKKTCIHNFKYVRLHYVLTRVAGTARRDREPALPVALPADPGLRGDPLHPPPGAHLRLHALVEGEARGGPAGTLQAWLPDGNSQIFRWYVFGPSGLWTMAPLHYAAKFDPFLSLDCARVEGAGVQSKERKGLNFAA